MADLQRMLELDTAFNFPHKSYKTIHVAGTNGKGSVTTKIASALTQLGFKTGLYTSPHIDTFHERIQINGEMISNEDASFFLNKILEISKEITFFEALTMLAFLYFQKKQVDFAVIETGLGGIFDPTNIISPILSVITSITYDHVKLLGNTLDQIGANKAGIIKPATPVVLGYRAALNPMIQKAIKENAPFHILPPEEDWMKENRGIAQKAIAILFPQAKDLDFSALPPCRFEKMKMEDLEVVFDIAHNEDGLTKLFQRIEVFYPEKPVFVIFGMSSDKCIDFAIDFLKTKAQAIFPFDVDNPRIMRREELANLLESEWNDLSAFIESARREKALLVVTGSAYIMSSAKKQLLLLNFVTI
jgi:dihydrofolate synthase/folylpolyglutamate synthase